MDKPVTLFQPRTTELTRLSDVMNRLFSESFVVPTFFNELMGGTARPAFPVNLYEVNDAYVLQVALPGIKLENLEIQVMGREVTIKGVFELHVPEKVTWIWRGLPVGEFCETFTLPFEVEREKVQATYENGILQITLPKVEYAKPKTIAVKMAH